MPIDASGVARIRHAISGTVYTIGPEGLDWEEADSDEREMGAEIAYEAEVEHSELGRLSWMVWEYPIGVFNHQETNVGQHTLLENFQFGISDREDAAADREARIKMMVDWFFENFEDPAERTPYETAEGGYIWIWGGPHDAADEIGSHFSGEDDALIDAAVERVQRDGNFLWAPTSSPDDYDLEDDNRDEGIGEGQPSVDGEEALDERVSTLEDILATIPTEPSGPVFDRTVGGTIDLVDWDGDTAPNGHLLLALREKAADLISQLTGTNGHQDLLQALIGYSDAIKHVSVPIQGLYVQGVFLENTSAQSAREIGAGDLPPLSGSVSSGLASLHQLHATLIMSTSTGVAMVEAAAKYRAPPANQDHLNQSIRDLTHAIRDAPLVFGPTARRMAEQAAANVGHGARPERSTHAASLLLQKMLAGTGKVIKFAAAAGLMTILGDGMAATVVGADTMGSVTALGNNAWNFLVNNLEPLRTFANFLGTDQTWLRQLTAWISTKRQ